MLTSYWANWWDLWLMYHKVTFDGGNRLMIVAPGVTSIDVKEDLYSDWKEWASMVANSHWPQAMRAVGGDPTVGAERIGASFFLMNGWRVRTWEGNHKLDVLGNLYVDGGGEPFVPTLGQWSVQINMTVSNLSTEISQPDVELARKLLTNRQIESGDGTVVTVYDDDDATVLGQWTWSEAEKTRGKFS